MKTLTFDYNSLYSPSAPFIEIEIGNFIADIFPFSIKAQVDSGADVTMLPISLLESIGAIYEETRYARDFGDKQHVVDIYQAAVRLFEQTFYLRVIAQEDSVDAIVGRDILNHLVVTLNGLAGVTEILVDA